MTKRTRWLDDLVVAGALAAVAACCALTGWTWRLDRLVYDHALAAWSRPPPSDVLIVAIDDASIDAIGRWPWSRAVHATLLERLAAARPRVIGLDLLLSEADADPGQDAVLARSLARAAPVVLPVAWRTDELRGHAPLLPIDTLRPWARLGSVDPSVDLDGVLRHGFLWAGTGNQRWPNIALAMLEAAGERPNVQLRPAFDPDPRPFASWQRDGRFAIRFAGPAGSFRTVSYVDVLRGAVPAERLAGSYVLVGATAQGLGDRQATPVDGGGSAMAGIEVLANQLATLRSPEATVDIGPGRTAALSVALLLLLVAAMTRVGPRRALALSLVAAPVAIASCAVLLAFGPWIAPMPFAVAALLAYPLWSWRRLERAMAGIDRGIEALSKDLPRPWSGDAIGSRVKVLREAAEVVRESRRFLAEALAAQPTAMLVADATQRVLLANAQAAALFQVEEAEDLVGLDLGRLLQELSTPQPVAWPDLLPDLTPAGFATQASIDDAHLMVHVAGLDAPDGRRYLVTLDDIGLVHQAQQEREEALGFVSHDLRAPAGAIVLLADLNLQGAVDTPREQLLGDVRRLASRTLALADAFVRASRAGSQALQRAPVAVGDLVEEALIDQRPAAAARAIRIDVDAPSAIVRVDRFLLSRAIGNLVSNAVRHAPSGSEVRVQAAVHGMRLRLRVGDRGPGLTPVQVEQLATAEHGASTGRADGVGLGLAFVQRVARRHGGGLRVVRSSSTAGTVLEIDIEAHDARNDANTDAAVVGGSSSGIP